MAEKVDIPRKIQFAVVASVYTIPENAIIEN
jgi:hypothetical protein